MSWSSPKRSAGLLALCLLLASGAAGRAADEARAGEAALEPIVVGTPERIEVFPDQFKLDSPRRVVHLVVTGFYADGSVQDLTRVAEFVPDERRGARGPRARSCRRSPTARPKSWSRRAATRLQRAGRSGRARKRPTRSRSTTARWPCSPSRAATRAPATARPAARGAFGCRCGPTIRCSTSRRWSARPSTAARICTSPRRACCCKSR